MISQISPAFYNRYNSYSISAYRNYFFYWVANLIILPTYFTCIFIIIQNMPDLLTEWYLSTRILIEPNLLIVSFIPLIVQGIAFVFLTMPMLSVLFTPVYLRLGFKGRGLALIVSTAVSFLLLFPRETVDNLFKNGIPNLNLLSQAQAETSQIFLLTSFVWFVIGILYFISSLPIVVRATFLAIFLFISVILLYFQFSIIDTFIQNIITLYDDLLLFITILSVFYAVTRTIANIYIEIKNGLTRLLLAAILFIVASFALILYIWFNKYDNKVVLIAFLGLLLIFFSVGPRNFVSRQIAHFRMITRSMRHDRLSSQSSPIVKSHNIINLFFTQWVPRFLSINNRWLFITLSIIIGGGVFPFIFRYDRTDLRDPFVLVIISFTLSFLFITLYICIWLVYNSRRFIATEFLAENNLDTNSKKDTQLSAIARLTTYILVEELQRISLLLKLRQVENTSLIGEDINTFFVTSGFDQDFINQIQQSVNLDVPNLGKVSLSNLLILALRFLARIRVVGKLQRLSNNSIQIWIELNYRNNQRAAVDLVILPENSDQDIDDVFIRPYARELAIKLFVELGQVDHLGSSWKSFANFLAGLEASSKRNWWQAIHSYQQAIQMEQTDKGSFGIGYYHLGAVLIFQGKWDEGIENLYTAELDGPIMAETQYMIAMALLQKYWSELHRRPIIFNEIDKRLEKALKLRVRFPEARQLRGKMYYRRGELEEREITKAYGKAKKSKSNFRHFYYQAESCYRHALRDYDFSQTGTQVNRNLFTEVQEEVDPLTKQRVTAAHQLGDALRILGKYSEADSYYQDVMVTHPVNLRNQIDLAKTYCLARNWQRAEEFLLRSVFIQDVHFWNADTSMHMGWALSGGVAYEYPILDSLLKRIYRKPSENRKDHANRLVEAMQFIDYALHQRPRYITYWKQTDWFTPFNDALRRLRLESFSFSNEIDFKINKLIIGNKYSYSNILRLWIALRIDSLIDFESNHTDKSLKLWWREDAQSFLNELKNENEYKNLYRIYSKLKIYRKKTYEILKILENNNRVGGLRYTYQRLKLGFGLYKSWTEADIQIQKFIELAICDNDTSVKFVERWLIDVYAEISLLLVRLFAEGNAYELVDEITEKANSKLELWLKRWNKIYKEADYTFSPRTLAFQRSALYAWQAYAKYQQNFNFLAKARCKSSTPPDQILDEIETLLEAAQEDIKVLPLCLFIRAKVLLSRSRYQDAVAEFERLLDFLHPYDPKRHLGSEKFREINSLSSDPNTPPKDSQRLWMYFMEKVAGRQQFEYIVNVSIVHTEISNIYRQLNKPELSVKHLMEAIRQSPSHDVDVDNFLRLAEDLNNMERYDEAYAVIQAVRIPSSKLHSIELSHTKRAAPSISECVVNTRGGRYLQSMEMCKLIAKNFQIQDLTSYLISLKDEVELLTNEVQIQNQNNKTEHEIKQLKKEIRWLKEVITEFKNVGGFINKNIPLNHPTELLSKLRNQLDIPKATSRNVLFLKRNRLKEDTYTQVLRDGLQTKGLENNIIPSIFKLLSIQQEKFEQASHLTRYSLNINDMQDLLELLANEYEVEYPITDIKRKNFKFIFATQVLYFFALQSGFALTQLAEVCNSLAYNRAESNLPLDHAYQDSLFSLMLMYYLMESTDDTNPARKSFKVKLTQFFDTYGWIYYRDRMSEINNINSENYTFTNYDGLLHLAEKYLKLGIQYDQSRAITHYHLARVYLTRFERIWQSSPEEVISANIGGSAKQINVYITEAFREWRASKDYDKFDRLHARLSWLYTRIRIYKLAWEDRGYKGIAGNNQAHIESFNDDPG